MADKTTQWIHMVGIAGAGMSGIAKVLHEQGHKVSGSDLQQNNITDNLMKMGIEIFLGHSSSNLREGVDLLAVSSAIPQNNPEVVSARENGIPVIKRGELLAQIVNQYKGIAVAGAHGKTTTTAMMYKVLSDSKLDPSFVLGGQLQSDQQNAKLGSGEYFVTESDESDASFLALSPYICIVTNIEGDHLDYYKSFSNLQKAFQQFINQVRTDGFAVLYGEDESIKKISSQLTGKKIFYGQSQDCDYYFANWQTEGLGSVFEVFKRGQKIGKLKLQIPGKHNALNALAVLAVAMEIGIDFQIIKDSLAGFSGANRRFQIIGKEKGVLIVDDYAHHPTEIKATLRATREIHPGRIIAVFQPHRYSRTSLLAKEFGRSFIDADMVFITDIYSAGEKKIAGVSGDLIYNAALQADCNAFYAADKGSVENLLLEQLKEGDLLITLGAGDIWKTGLSILNKL